MLPLVAILAASSVLGPEVDDGSIVYLLSKPVSRYGVAISKWVVALGATLAAGALPILVGALITGDSTRAVALFVGAVVAGTTYSALFLAISAVTRHAVIASLMFVLIWESLLGNLFTGVAWLSIGQWGVRVGHALSDQLPDPANLPWAIGASAVVTWSACGSRATGCGRSRSAARSERPSARRHGPRQVNAPSGTRRLGSGWTSP